MPHVQKVPKADGRVVLDHLDRAFSKRKFESRELCIFFTIALPLVNAQSNGIFFKVNLKHG